MPIAATVIDSHADPIDAIGAVLAEHEAVFSLTVAGLTYAITTVELMADDGELDVPQAVAVAEGFLAALDRIAREFPRLVNPSHAEQMSQARALLDTLRTFEQT